MDCSQARLLIPRLGLGTWKADKNRVGAAVLESLRLGFRHIDCAPIYGNEPEVGAALAAWPGNRAELWLTSKLWNDAHRPEDVMPALKKSLFALKQSYLDSYLIHWPMHYKPGISAARRAEDVLPPEAIPLEETWQAMENCVRAGLTRSIGVCNFSLARLQALWETATIKPALIQIERHPFLPQHEILAFCRSHSVLAVGFSPLGSPDRPKAIKGPDEPEPLKHGVIASLARKHGISPAQLLLAWALERGTAVLVKSVSPRHLRENFAARDLRLDAEDRERLAALACGFRFLTGEGPENSPYTQNWLWNS